MHSIPEVERDCKYINMVNFSPPLNLKYSALPDSRLHRRNLRGQRACAALVQDMESFSAELVRRLIVEFGLTREELILNTFSVPGTVLYMLHRMKVPQVNIYKNTRGINNIWHPV